MGCFWSARIFCWFDIAWCFRSGRLISLVWFKPRFKKGFFKALGFQALVRKFLSMSVTGTARTWIALKGLRQYWPSTFYSSIQILAKHSPHGNPKRQWKDNTQWLKNQEKSPPPPPKKKKRKREDSSNNRVPCLLDKRISACFLADATLMYLTARVLSRSWYIITSICVTARTLLRTENKRWATVNRKQQMTEAQGLQPDRAREKLTRMLHQL